MRVTRLDGCGNPVPGYASSVVTDGFISVGLTANTDEGTSISVQNANGKTCILDEPCPQFTGYSIEIALCGVSPALINLLTGQPYDLNPAGDIAGFRMNSDIDACDSGFALELWSNVPATACVAGQTAAFGYMLIPFVKGGVLGDFTIANDAVNFTVSGANSKEGSGWDVGPYDVLPDSGGDPGPLWEPVLSGDHLIIEVTDVPPPDPDCDPIAIGSKATGLADTGVWTPADGSHYPAWDLADMTGVTASPATLWGPTKYGVTGDGGHVRWNGTTWIAAS
jgi:hypothetical protein